MSNLPPVKYPWFDTKQPSTGKAIKYRPYTVGEEKILLVAAESGDANQIKLALKQIITACVVDAAEVETWPTFDIEYIFLQLRSKSIGNMVAINVRLVDCPDKPRGELCDVSNSIDVNLDDLKLTVSSNGTEVEFNPKDYKKTTNVKVSDTLAVQLRYPNYDDMDIIKSLDGELNADDLGYEMLARCTIAFYDEASTYTAANSTIPELIEYYKTFPRTQIEKLDEFFKAIPTVSTSSVVKCKKCGKTETHKLEGINSFFV